MFLEIALVLSVLLQFGAFFITISLIPKTRFNVSWIMISIGFLLMALRRLSEFLEILNVEQTDIQAIINSWIGILISVLMFISSLYIRRIFRFQDKIDKFRKETEAKVLSAIIKTEEQERQKFAKELHDGLGPLLSSIKMAISAINKSIVGKTNEQIIEKTEITVDNAIVTIKEISNNLSPHILERFGVEKAIKTFIDTIITKENLKINFTSNIKSMRFEYNMEVILYRIICELISNTLKHAFATVTEVSIYKYENKIELFYFDNGIGFNTNNINSKGMGLSNINSRVKSLDGEMEMQSKNKQGFFLKINLPI